MAQKKEQQPETPEGVNAEDALDQLSLVLGFFPRVDGKASVVLAVETGMLAVLSSRFPGFHAMTSPSWLLLAVSLALIAASFFFLYRTAYPDIKGGEQSLIFFREIAGRTEANFTKQFAAQTEDERMRDALGQVWRNSVILRMKFDALRVAFVLMGRWSLLRCAWANGSSETASAMRSAA